MSQQVILVDESDRALGTSEKMAAHEAGVLHRAFSIFLFDARGRWLLQQRHPGKYHSGGLWTNTCCSHPGPGELTEVAARKRLRQEMGIEAEIAPAFQFRYRAELDNDLIEHELDHVFLGDFEGVPAPDPVEVSDWRWIPESELLDDLSRQPEAYTYWFRVAVPRILRERAGKAVS